MINDFFMTDADDFNVDIEFSKFKKEETLFAKKDLVGDDDFLRVLKEEYISSLKKEYNADSSLFDSLDDLVEESEDKDKLIDILNSL